MATGSYCTRSLLPWRQITPADDAIDCWRGPESYVIDLAAQLGRGTTHQLFLFQSAADGRWRWYVADLAGGSITSGRHDGYQRPDRAEHQMMLALSKVLHDVASLPHLPPSLGSASAPVRGGE